MEGHNLISELGNLLGEGLHQLANIVLQIDLVAILILIQEYIIELINMLISFYEEYLSFYASSFALALSSLLEQASHAIPEFLNSL